MGLELLTVRITLVYVAQSLVFGVVVCQSLFVLFILTILWSILWITISDYNFRFVKLLVNKKEYKQTITWLFNFHRFGPMIQCMFPLRFPHRKRWSVRLNVCMRMHVLLCCLLFVFFPVYWCPTFRPVFVLWDPCCDVRYDFRIKTMSGSSCPPVFFVGGLLSNYVVCFIVHGGV